MRLAAPLAFLPLALIIGCDGSEGLAPVDGPTWHGDIAPIFEAHCNQCHASEDSVAPYRFDTYASAVALSGLLGHTIASGAMPPWPASLDSAAMLSDISLSDAQRETIATWLDDGMPEGDPAAPGEPIEIPREPFVRTDYTIEMPVAYSGVPGEIEDYRCFVVDWPADEAGYVTGVDVKPGNRAAVHHVLMFNIPPEQAETFEAFDAQEEGPGYGCYGRPVPSTSAADDGPGTSGFLAVNPMMGWVPGIDGRGLPDDTGLYITPGSKVVLQMHYFGLGDHPDPDQTAVRFTFEPEVASPACNLPLVDPTWPIVPGMMHIPAGETDVLHSFSTRLGDSVGSAVCRDIDWRQPSLIRSVIPHMHKIGQRIRVSVRRADGSDETVVDVPAWDFNWQLDYVLADPIYVGPDDEVAIDCWFDNTSEARSRAGLADTTEHDVGWGDGTRDEMCIAFVQISNL